MAGLSLNAITENASRLGMRLQESFSEHTRDLGMSKNTSYLELPDEKMKQIASQLDSNSDREKLDAMKRLVALISKGRNVSQYFAQVVKNVASQNLEIRKLVYIFLLRYAEQEPDLTLLSINTFQRDLNDSSPLIRAMALRVLSGIKVPLIGSIVILAIKKCAADVSPYVRKAAALAIPKCYDLDASHLPSLVGTITTLLRDRSPLSIGSVAVAFEYVCPTRLDLLHGHYRRLCMNLADVDEWGQVSLLNLLIRYARTMLLRPNTVGGASDEIDRDLQLLLTSSEPLLQSRNPAVVLAVTRVLYYAGCRHHLQKVVNPLLRLLNFSAEVERIVLTYILLISRSFPSLFSAHFSRFLVRADDVIRVKRDKVQLLLGIIDVDNQQAIVREFIDYADDTDDEFVSDSIRALGSCARVIPEYAQQCITSLIAMIQSGKDVVITNAVIVLKFLIQTQLQQPTTIAGRPTQGPRSIISHLAYGIDDIKHSHARACVIWLVGQYSQRSAQEKNDSQGDVVEWAPDVLRKTAKFYTLERPVTKIQIATLAAKLFVLSPMNRTLELLSRYVLSLARYDLNYDVRDHARMMTSLLAGVFQSIDRDEGGEDRGSVVLRREQVRLVLFQGKQDVVSERLHTDYDHALIGSLGVITGKSKREVSSLPDWLEEGTDSSLRDSAEPAPRSYEVKPMPPLARTNLATSEGSTPTAVLTSLPKTDLERFYEDTEDGEEEEEEEEEEDSESESSEEDMDGDCHDSQHESESDSENSGV